jgi:hypothetical protein
LRLRNCPFAPLAGETPQLVSGINHAFLTGFIDSLQASALTAVLVPRRLVLCRTDSRLTRRPLQHLSCEVTRLSGSGQYQNPATGRHSTQVAEMRS